MPAALLGASSAPPLGTKEKRHHIHPFRIFKLFGASFGQTICTASRSGIHLSYALRPNLLNEMNHGMQQFLARTKTYQRKILTGLSCTQALRNIPNEGLGAQFTNLGQSPDMIMLW
jgi:hypothetical protein